MPHHTLFSPAVRRPAPLRHPLVLAVTLACAGPLPAITAFVPAAIAQPAAELRYYDIPAGPLPSALTRLVRESGLFLGSTTELAAGRTSAALRGHFTPTEALSRLLAGSGLEAVPQADGSFALRAVAADGVVQLSRVQVTSYEPLNAGVSGNLRVVTADDIDTVQANDLADVFRRTPSVAVGGSVGIAEKIYVRGLEDALLNVTIDGATQAGVLFHHTGRLTVEPELLKKVEVHAGAGVATDGPGALGGAIRFITKDPEDMLRPGERIGALLKAGYFDNAEGYKVSANVFGRFNDDWSAMASLAKADSDAIEDGDGNRLRGTDSEQTMGFFKLVGQLSEGQTLRLGYDRREDDGIRPQRPQWVISSWNPGYPLKIERDTVTVNYQLSPAASEWLNLDTTVYDTRSEVTQNVIGRWGVYHGSTESRGLTLRNTTPLGDHELVYGVDYRRDRVYAGPGGDSRQYDEDGSVRGLFLQDSYQATDKLLISAGVRYDEYELDDNTGQHFESDGFSPNLGVSYQLTPELTVNAAYAEALRGRQTTETFLLDSRRNAPDLKEEQAKNTEIGFEYRRAAFSFSGTFYRARIDDAINDQARVFYNIGDIETDGFDLRASYDWSRVQAGLSYSHFDSDLVGGDTDLQLNAYDHGALGNTIGDTWTLDIAWQVNDAVDVGWNSRIVEGVDNVRTSAGRIDQPGYAVHDIYARWRINTDLTVTFTVLNLFDKYYVDHATNASYEHIPGYEGVVGLAEPGRDLRLSVAWRL